MKNVDQLLNNLTISYFIKQSNHNHCLIAGAKSIPKLRKRFDPAIVSSHNPIKFLTSKLHTSLPGCAI